MAKAKETGLEGYKWKRPPGLRGPFDLADRILKATDEQAELVQRGINLARLEIEAEIELWELAKASPPDVEIPRSMVSIDNTDRAIERLVRQKRMLLDLTWGVPQED